MSEHDQTAEPLDDDYYEGGRRRKRRGLAGCLAVLVALAVVVGALWFGVTKGVELIRDQFADPADYDGPGRGRVVYEVEEGDSVADMGRGLKEAGVVASVQAFLNAAQADPDSTGIQVGFYRLQKEMPAADALEVLTDPDNILRNSVTVPEGLRVDDILEVLAEETDFSVQQYRAVLENPARIGLPDYAGGNAEGYLFPSTYDFGPKET
ncbi:MAG TPA: endolytic transglycosylase MltG, partial [Nocardioides sp.]|nr:endolytic transglycosylase MltG [Nocardioides sp.]